MPKDPGLNHGNDFVTDTPIPHIYRVDKVVVPASARDEFFARARAARSLLQHHEGFVRSTYLEQFSGPGEFNVVTIAEWKSLADIDQATSLAQPMQTVLGTSGRAKRTDRQRRHSVARAWAHYLPIPT